MKQIVYDTTKVNIPNLFRDWKTTRGYIYIERERERERGGAWKFYGYWKNIKKISFGNSRGQLKKKWNFQDWSKKHLAEFPYKMSSFLVFKISKGCNRVSRNLQGQSFLSSRISKSKLIDLKNSVVCF